jgi:hypothetical protein
MVDALAAALLGEPVLIHDDLADGRSVTVVAAGRRSWSDHVVAMAMPRWRADGPRSVPAGVTAIHQVSDLGLVVDADLATASVDLLRLVGADPVVLHLDATVEPSVEVSLSAVLQAWCRRALTVAHLSDARLPTGTSTFTVHVLRDVQENEHVMLSLGDDPARGPNEVMPECVVGTAMGGLGCGCRARIDEALRNMERAGAGSLLLIRAGRSELAAPGACAQWSRNDPAAALRQDVLRDAALVSVMDHQRRRTGGDTSTRVAPA